MLEITANFFLLLRGQLLSLWINQAFQFSYILLLFFFFLAILLITCSKKETRTLKMQTSITLIHISTFHKITNKGVGDHLQLPILLR